ncbi:MAG: glycosyltransferase [Candidatus Omnitrophica bacterium]|nr:glycosyltransferase [Candidatus Omnitrophota bacterium]
MKTIAMIPNGHILSHLVRLLVIARELRSRGHKVIFAGSGKYMQIAEDEGFDVSLLLEAEHEKLMAAVRKNKINFISFNELEPLVKADIEFYNKVKPDLVLSDGRISAIVSSRIRKVPHGAVVNASSTGYRAIPYVPLFPFLSKIPFKKNFIFQELNVKIECAVFDLFMRAYTKLSRKYKLTRPVKTSQFLTGSDFTLLPDIPEYFPTCNLPENFHYIGPLPWESKLPPPSWINALKKDSPVIYITMGSTTPEDIYQYIQRVFTKLDYQVVLTTGGQVRSEIISSMSVPGKIFVENYVNGDLVMQKSNVVICHGGNGTIYQAIKNGVPIVGIPTHHDQAYNMKRVENLGIGIKVSYEQFTKAPLSLLNDLKRIFSNNSFRETISKYQKIVNAYTPAKTAVNIIEERYM